MDKDREEEIPVSALVAQRGIKTSTDFADFMSGLMSDLVENRIDPETARAACIAGDKLLAMVKLQMQFGKSNSGKHEPLQLSGKAVTSPANGNAVKGRDPVVTSSGDGS